MINSEKIEFWVPFYVKKVPFWSPFCSKLGPLLVSVLEFWGPLVIVEQCPPVSNTKEMTALEVDWSVGIWFETLTKSKHSLLLRVIWSAWKNSTLAVVFTLMSIVNVLLFVGKMFDIMGDCSQTTKDILKWRCPSCSKHYKAMGQIGTSSNARITLICLLCPVIANLCLFVCLFSRYIVLQVCETQIVENIFTHSRLNLR